MEDLIATRDFVLEDTSSERTCWLRRASLIVLRVLKSFVRKVTLECQDKEKWRYSSRVFVAEAVKRSKVRIENRRFGCKTAEPEVWR